MINLIIFPLISLNYVKLLEEFKLNTFCDTKTNYEPLSFHKSKISQLSLLIYKTKILAKFSTKNILDG